MLPGRQPPSLLQISLLPDRLLDPLEIHRELVRHIHLHDLAERYGGVEIPSALGRKLRGADRSWAWQYVFPASH